MIRRPYRTACRFFRDSEVESTVHWYIVPPTNPVLGFPCRINSLDWRDNRMNPGPVGEVTFAERPFDGWGRIVPPIPGDHLCGTREDFELGGRYLPDDPPFERGADGIPLCCRPDIGGIEVGGEAIWPEVWVAGEGGIGLDASAYLDQLSPGVAWPGALVTPGVWYFFDSAVSIPPFWMRWASSVGDVWEIDTRYSVAPVYGFGPDEAWANPPFLADPLPWDVFTMDLKAVTHLIRTPFADVHVSWNSKQTNNTVMAFRVRGPL